MLPIYVSCYTIDTPYERETPLFMDSLLSAGITRHDIQGVKHLGSWVDNCAYKATFVRNMLLKHNCPVVWLDIDSRVRQYPHLFDSMDCDFAAHWMDGTELLSGVLYFANTQKAWNIAQKWVSECALRIGEWDQKCLQSVAEADQEAEIFDLPPQYCQIFDTMARHGQPVIEQTQASRRYRDAVSHG
jgi:hypothetical protein